MVGAATDTGTAEAEGHEGVVGGADLEAGEGDRFDGGDGQGAGFCGYGSADLNLWAEGGFWFCGDGLECRN